MANEKILAAFKCAHDDGDVLVVVGATTAKEFRAAVVDAELVRMHAHEEGTEHDQPLHAFAAWRFDEKDKRHLWDLDVEKDTPGARPAMVANAYWAEACEFAGGQMHAQLLSMLGAETHEEAGGIIGRMKARELVAERQGVQPFGYVNTCTGQFFKDVEPSRKNNEGHWRTVYEHTAQLAAAQQGVQRIQANCYSDNDGDSWHDSPDDCDFVEGLKVGDTFELQASIRAWSETFRVTKAPDETGDDYEVELVSTDAPLAAHPTQQGPRHGDYASDLKKEGPLVITLENVNDGKQWCATTNHYDFIVIGQNSAQDALSIALKQALAAHPTQQGLDALAAALAETRRELHACQSVIHLAGGFDPRYVTDAQAAIKKADAALAAKAKQEGAAS